ncbi:MAG: hypothetical protein GXC72_12285, partial [Chitinophagaceae bacterium]|nr:hypothetical protein [Chitinophagaceae bacterium]
MTSNFQIEEDKLYIPENLLKRLWAQLKIIVSYQRNGQSIDSISAYLKKYLDEILKAKNEGLYYRFIAAGIGISAANVERAFKGKKGAQKVNVDFEVQYDLLYFLCYACWEESLINIIRSPSNDWGNKTLYHVIIPENEKEELEKLKNIDSTITSELNHEVKEIEQAFSKSTETSPDISKEINYSKPASNEIFDCVDQSFWNKYKSKKDKSELIDYYLRADTERLLPYIMMFDDGSENKLYISPDNEFEITNELTNQKTLANLSAIFSNSSQKKVLLKVLSEGGEGKTSLLFHIAKEYFLEYNIIKLKVNRELDSIIERLPIFLNDNPVIILIDNAMNHKNSLEKYSNSFELLYGDSGFTVILSERLNFYESNYYLEARFDNIYSLDSKVKKSKLETFFNILWKELEIQSDDEKYEMLKNEFISSTLPLRNKVKHLLSSQGIQTKFNTREDWQNWETFINNKPEYYSIRRLYTVVALFNKFGLSVPVKLKVLTYPIGGDNFLIIEALSKTYSPPFLIEKIENEEYLRLRHDTAADEYFSHEANRAKGVVVLKEFFESLSDKYSASLFRNLQEHKEFKNDNQFNYLLDDERRVKLLDTYYNQTNEPGEKGKTLIRLSVLLINLTRYNEAIDLLNSFLKYNDNAYAKTLLASIYLRPEYSKIVEAEELLLQVLLNESNNVYAIEKLLYIYSKLTPNKYRLDEFIKKLPHDIKQNNKLLISIIQKYIGANDLVNAYRNTLIYIENNPNEDATFLVAKILSKSDDLKNHLFDYCLKQRDLNFAETILKSIQEKSHISYTICFAQLLIYQNKY